MFHPRKAWAKIAAAFGIGTVVTEVATPRIDMLAGPGSARDRAARLVDDIKRDFPDGAVQAESTEVLTAVLQGALVLPLDKVAAAGLARLDNGVVLAHALLGGQGDDVGVRLYEILTSARAEATGTPGFDDLDAATRSLADFYGPGQSVSSRRASFKAALNKVDQLVTVGSAGRSG